MKQREGEKGRMTSGREEIQDSCLCASFVGDFSTLQRKEKKKKIKSCCKKKKTISPNYTPLILPRTSKSLSLVGRITWGVQRYTCNFHAT